MGPNQIYKLLHSKGNQNQNRKDWEKIFASYATSKYLISKIHKQLIKHNNKKKIKQPNQKLGIKRYVSKEDIQMADRHMKKWSTSLIIRQMQIKTTMRYYLTPVRGAKIKKPTDNKSCRGCGENGALLPCWWECELV